jgi:glycosyltransferase involved in cell wall biosynthesis
MAMGKPVIASAIGGIPEQVEDGKTGFLFAMGNAEDLVHKMVFLAQNGELKKKMGEAAREKAEREYSLKTHYSKLIDIYTEVMAKN